MNLREMELFGTLMRVGTTTETARLLGISQPGVSAQLKRLESKLGIPLFHRAGNRLEPTREAREIFSLAGPIFTTHSQVRAKLPSLRDHASRPAVISATPALVEGFLGPLLVKAGYANWKKRLDLRIHAPEEDLRNGVADLGLQMALPPKAEFQAHMVGRSSLVAIMGKNHPLARAKQLKCKAIAAHPLVCYDADWSPMGAHIRAAFKARDLHYDPVCTAPYCANVCALVRACGGVGIVDAMTAKNLATPGLTWRPISDLSDISIIAFYRRNEPLSATVMDLLNHLLQAEAGKRPDDALQVHTKRIAET